MFSLPEDFVTAAFDYTIYISINYKEKYITAVFEKNVLKNEKKIPLVAIFSLFLYLIGSIVEVYSLNTLLLFSMVLPALHDV